MCPRRLEVEVMARVTQAKKVEQDNEKAALAFFNAALASLPDPRRPQGVRYPFITVIVSALMGMVCGCDDAEALALWSKGNADWLGGFLELPHGPPTRGRLSCRVRSIESQSFQRCISNLGDSDDISFISARQAHRR